MNSLPPQPKAMPQPEDQPRRIPHTDDETIQQGDFVFAVPSSGEYIIPGFLEVSDSYRENSGEKYYSVRQVKGSHHYDIVFYTKDEKLATDICLAIQLDKLHERVKDESRREAVLNEFLKQREKQ